MKKKVYQPNEGSLSGLRIRLTENFKIKIILTLSFFR